MSLRFIMGSSGSGKSRLLFETALSEADRHPDRRFIVLVPEQFTLQTQRDLTLLSKRGGILNIDVLSFTRLAYRVFEQTGFSRRSVLSETGKSLMLRLIASRSGDESGILAGIMDRPGTVAQIKSILSELDQYQISQEQLLELENDLQKEGTRGRLAMKIREIRLLRESFERYQEDRFITGEKLPVILAEKAPFDPTLKDAEFFLDGYTGFTPAQLMVITSLLGICRQMTVTLTIDPSEPQLLSADPVKSLAASRPGMYELFALSKRTARSLTECAKDAGVSIDTPVILDGGNGRHREGSELWFLEKHLFRGTAGPAALYPAERPDAGSGSGNGSGQAEAGNTAAGRRHAPHQIFFRQCADPYDEVLSAAVTIEELIRQGYRYRDIALVCGNLSEYAEYIKKILSEYGIPYFVDSSSPVTLNPAFEFAESSIEIPEKNFSYESVMRFLRTGLALDNDSGEVDLLENYILAAGIRGRKAWEGPFTRKTKDGDEVLRTAAESARAQFMERFTPYADVMKKGKASLKERAAALWDLIVSFDVPAKLDRMRASCAENGRNDRASEYAQVVRVISQVLDEAVMLMGDEAVTRTQFEQILRAGFSDAKIGSVPPGTDEVHAGDLKRTRLEHIKAVIFMGLNDGFVPERKAAGGVLTDMEREYLESRHFHLSPTSREDAGIQRFYLYMALTKPSDMLILSWSVSDRSGSERQKAYAADLIMSYFPGRELLTPVSADPYLAVTSRGTGRKVLAMEISGYAAGDSEETRKREGQLKELLKIYAVPGAGGSLPETDGSLTEAGTADSGACESDAAKCAEDMLGTAFDKKSTPELDSDCAIELYGNVLSGSVSRLEEFALCPFRQYASYGLRLRDREEFEVQLPDIGTLLHLATEIFSARLGGGDAGYTWNDVPDDARDRLAAEAVREAARMSRPELFEDTARNRAVLDRCTQIMIRSARTMQTQVKGSLFVPSRFETDFGGAGSSMADIPLPYGGLMRLRGRIDRIDECDDPVEKKLYIKVVDNKTSQHTLKLDRIIDGEQLQLITYLDAAAAMEKNARPDRDIVCAGIFYYDLQDPVLKAEDVKDDPEKAVLKRMRVTGFLDRSPDVIRRLDVSLMPGEDSLIIPVSLDKNGNPGSRGSSALSTEQIGLLRKYVRGRLGEFGSQIQGGVIDPHPSRHSEQENACAWCRFRDVCHFDPHSGKMNYAQRRTRSDDEDWEIIKHSCGEETENQRSDGGRDQMDS